MAEMPTCNTCGNRHWRFAKCEDAERLARTEAQKTAEHERLKVRAEYTAPPGYVRVGPNKFARATTQPKPPTFVQIAPGKYRKAGSR